MSDSYHCNSPRVENSNYLGIQSFKDVFCIATISGGQAQLRYNSRFFVQVRHETTYAYSGNHHFFTISCHRQTYHNYYGPPQRSQNSDFPSHFSASKMESFWFFFSLKNIWLGDQPFSNFSCMFLDPNNFFPIWIQNTIS